VFVFVLQGNWLATKSNAMKIIWGIGILAAGQSSTMTVSSCIHFLNIIGLSLSYLLHPQIHPRLVICGK